MRQPGIFIEDLSLRLTGSHKIEESLVPRIIGLPARISGFRTIRSFLTGKIPRLVVTDLPHIKMPTEGWVDLLGS
jgi:hypothetical protein